MQNLQEELQKAKLVRQLKLDQKTKETIPSPPAKPSPPPKPCNLVSTVVSENESTEDRFAKYKTMKKLNLPEGAIRQKMMTDGFSLADQNFFFDAVTNITDSASPVLEKPITIPPIPPPPKQPIPVSSTESAVKTKSKAEPICQGTPQPVQVEETANEIISVSYKSPCQMEMLVETKIVEQVKQTDEPKSDEAKVNEHIIKVVNLSTKEKLKKFYEIKKVAENVFRRNMIDAGIPLEEIEVFLHASEANLNKNEKCVVYVDESTSVNSSPLSSPTQAVRMNKPISYPAVVPSDELINQYDNIQDNKDKDIQIHNGNRHGVMLKKSRESEVSGVTTSSNSVASVGYDLDVTKGSLSSIPNARSPVANSPSRSTTNKSNLSSLRNSPEAGSGTRTRPTSEDCTKFSIRTKSVCSVSINALYE